MKRLNSTQIAASALALALSWPVLAEPPAAPPSPPAPDKPMMGGMGDMMGGMSEDMKDQMLKRKQENFLKMVDLSNKILATKDDKERDSLKAEQLQIMKEYEKGHHDMMRQHMQQMMQQGGMGGMGGMQHGGSGGGGMGGMQHGGPGGGGMGGMQHGGSGGGGMGGMQHDNKPADNQLQWPVTR